MKSWRQAIISRVIQLYSHIFRSASINKVTGVWHILMGVLSVNIKLNILKKPFLLSIFFLQALSFIFSLLKSWQFKRIYFIPTSIAYNFWIGRYHTPLNILKTQTRLTYRLPNSNLFCASLQCKFLVFLIEDIKMQIVIFWNKLYFARVD